MTAGDDIYLSTLYGAAPVGQFVEIRWKRPDGMGRAFLPVHDFEGIRREIDARTRTTDVYVGVAPRARQGGTRQDVELAHVLWVDCDDEAARESLRNFRPRPTLVIGSGNGLHAYWRLSRPLTPDQVERANARLAHALGADPRVIDAPRILRPPGTWNHKRDEPLPVELVYSNPEGIYGAAQVVGDLKDPPQDRPARPSEPRTIAADSPVLSIAPTTYVPILTGREPNRAEKIKCPFHGGGDERTPSFHVYPDADRGWCCFGCGTGGTIIDLAGALWGIETRGRGYLQILDRLEREIAPARVAA